MWAEETAKESFHKYFPEKFKKRTPSTKFFWQVYAKMHLQKFKEIIAGQITKFTSEAKADTKITVSPRMNTLMQRISAKPDDLVLLSCLNRNQKS